MSAATHESASDVRSLLLSRRGIVFVSSSGKSTPALVRGVELELSELGYAVSTRLSARLAQCEPGELAALRTWAIRVLSAHVGADQTHVPLFRSFPDDIPSDTTELWWRKVLCHFLQADGQPCLFCRQHGTTHVLNPCQHVVCDSCFDGASYSACPVCEHHVDQRSPFFRKAPVRFTGNERVAFKLLDLGGDPIAEARAWFGALCGRAQAMSPADRDALVLIVNEHAANVLQWLPDAIPVRENVAAVFGTLFTLRPAAEVFPEAQRFMTTATDVLRFIAVLSGTDGSLLPEARFATFTVETVPRHLMSQVRKLVGLNDAARGRSRHVTSTTHVKRFKMARLSRPLRRALLAILDGLAPDRLTEDMLRHRSYWVWAGEFLHPHEYAARFPNAARAFAVVRMKAPDGTKAPTFLTWNARIERGLLSGATSQLVDTLRERPGELARRFDHVLRRCEDAASRERVLETFVEQIPSMATPVLMTLRSHLATRSERAPVRLYWPKGRVAMGASTDDNRVVLPLDLTKRAVRAISTELLSRFATKPFFKECVIDEGLRRIIVPFNERTTSRAAVSLPRGSRLNVPTDRVLRLFLHWCQPQGSDRSSDLDLSVAFYDSGWSYVGVCSYYELQLRTTGGLIAQSAGDLRDAPFPKGATELVDIHRAKALDSGARYAVMVVNNYAGMPFSQLERGFAGLMLRDAPGGPHFDPRTVELKFTIGGENGVFIPLVLDLRDSVLHWLDVQARGELKMNNVESSKRAITRIAPAALAYFESGVRPSMFELALLHAASRCHRVLIRGATTTQFTRGERESADAFLARLMSQQHDGTALPAHDEATPVLAFLLRGDITLHERSSIYALFRDKVSPNLAASDLL